MNCSIPLHLATSKTYLAILGPCALVIGVLLVFALAGKASTPMKRVALAGAVLVNIGIAGYFMQQALGAKLVVESGVLTAKAGGDSVTLPLSDLRLDESADASTMRYPVRTRGTSIGGISTGWFQRDDGKKAFLLRPSGPSTLIPTTLEYDLVLPTSALEELRACFNYTSAGKTTGQ